MCFCTPGHDDPSPPCGPRDSTLAEEIRVQLGCSYSQAKSLNPTKAVHATRQPEMPRQSEILPSTGSWPACPTRPLAKTLSFRDLQNWPKETSCWRLGDPKPLESRMQMNIRMWHSHRTCAKCWGMRGPFFKHVVRSAFDMDLDSN